MELLDIKILQSPYCQQASLYYNSNTVSLFHQTSNCWQLWNNTQCLLWHTTQRKYQTTISVLILKPTEVSLSVRPVYIGGFPDRRSRTFCLKITFTRSISTCCYSRSCYCRGNKIAHGPTLRGSGILTSQAPRTYYL